VNIKVWGNEGNIIRDYKDTENEMYSYGIDSSGLLTVFIRHRLSGVYSTGEPAAIFSPFGYRHIELFREGE
jgi:hypothetical protein